MSKRTMAHQRILQCSDRIRRWKTRVRYMGLTVGLVILLGSPVHAQHRGGFRGGRHGGFRGRQHGGFGHHGSRRHHGGGLHLGFGLLGGHHFPDSGHHVDGGHHEDSRYHLDASVVYRPPIHESDYLHGRNYQTGGSTLQRAEDGLTAGKRYFKQERYSLAVKAFQRAVLAAPREGVPKLYFGLAHFAIGDYEYAAYAIRRGMDRVPNLGRDEMDPRYPYGNSADFHRHLASLHAHVESSVRSGDARFLLGYMLYHAGHYSPAVEQFDLVLRIDSGDRQAARLRQIAIERTTG